MLYLVTGGSGSGKSEYAENLAVSLKKENLIYIATMFPFDDESLKKIERHKIMRKNKGFLTKECYKNLEDISIYKNSTVLLDCMSNLVANEMYMENKEDKPLSSVCVLVGIFENVFTFLFICVFIFSSV